MKNAKNVLGTIAGKVAGVFANLKNSGWYDPTAVNGKFVDELVQELTAHGFEFRTSAPFTRMVDGVNVGGFSGTYARLVGDFSWEQVSVHSGGHQPDSSKLMVYFGIDANVGGRGYFGIPELSIGVSLPSREWSHMGTTTDVFRPDGRQPSSQYAPGISAKAALAMVGLKGLEAKV